MSLNKLALVRYKTIDACLQNRYRKWSLDDLIESVSEALDEYEGIKTGVSKRTIQLDLQLMRSDKLGYNAPISVVDKKYYVYDDAEYSITKSDMRPQDLDTLTEVLSVLEQFKGFSYFEDIAEMTNRVQSKISQRANPGKTYISFEKNERMAGIEWLDTLLKAIQNRQVLNISYQSFRANKPTLAIVYPYLLKEYRNRWFLLCASTTNATLQHLALDRMLHIGNNDLEKFKISQVHPIESFYDNAIGVSKSEIQEVFRCVLKVDAANTPYLKTKPLHQSQELISESEDGGIFSIQVVLNFELEREILGFGESMQVLEPRLLQKKIARRIAKMFELTQGS
jgi:predicted DNA-binding transcriptional regulator YafY